jgi:hypothetical protein
VGVVLNPTVRGGTVAKVDVDAAAPLEIPYAVRWLVPKGERFATSPS